ncbi:MAG: hypothetical protein EHM48_00095 [Planctomycetaceae bacterium]|nr:MAG: hypothetical protein EHM48_00095 [Planctomycetaceae bacterium]
MSEPVIIAVVGIVGAALGALIAQLPALRRGSSQARLDEAQADHEQHKAAALINKELREEISRLSLKVTSLETRAVEYERRTTLAETRFADAETRSTESRRVVIVLGEKLDEARATIDKLVILTERLLTCIESPEQAKEIDMPGVKSMIHLMKKGWAS